MNYQFDNWFQQAVAVESAKDTGPRITGLRLQAFVNAASCQARLRFLIDWR